MDEGAFACIPYMHGCSSSVVVSSGMVGANGSIFNYLLVVINIMYYYIARCGVLSADVLHTLYPHRVYLGSVIN